MNHLHDQPPCTDDPELALTLMTMWALWSGHPMPGPPVSLLSEQQLIDFWAE
jgi:hypothetical protein